MLAAAAILTTTAILLLALDVARTPPYAMPVAAVCFLAAAVLCFVAGSILLGVLALVAAIAVTALMPSRLHSRR